MTDYRKGHISKTKDKLQKKELSILAGITITV